jgi:formate/nitrite transporter
MTVDDRSPREIARHLDSIIQRKSRASRSAQFFFGVLAGIYIGFGAVASTTVGAFAGLPPGLSKFLSASIFCVGLILVIIPGSELFTGNILMSAGLVTRAVSPRKVVRNWVFVYAGNFVGAALLALTVYGTGLMGSAAEPSPVGRAAANIADAKMSLPVVPATLRGVLCNMLLCLAVIMAVGSRTNFGKIMCIYFPITAFVLSGFEHSVANMYFLPAGLFAAGDFRMAAAPQCRLHSRSPAGVGGREVPAGDVRVAHPRRRPSLLCDLYQLHHRRVGPRLPRRPGYQAR